MVWNVWETVFEDNKADMSQYDLIGGRVQVRDDVICLGAPEFLQTQRGRFAIESFLRPRVARYQDVDITVKLQIESTGKTDGINEDPSHWFGISTRAIRPSLWDAYLYYIRKDGRVEFGIKDHPIEKPPRVESVASQPVTFRIKVEGSRVQTWVNERPYHDWQDKDGEFIRKGSIYLISHVALVRIYEIQIKVKKWYAPLLRFCRRSWMVIVVLGVVGSVIGLFVWLLSWLWPK